MGLVFREPATHRFEDFELDVYGGLLRRSGEPVPLRAKAFQVLRLLVENPGRLIAREELLEVVWPGRIVTDDSVHQCVAEIRAVLGDARHRKIRTVRKRGYRFELPVATVRAPGARAQPGSGAAVDAGSDSGAAPSGDRDAEAGAPAAVGPKSAAAPAARGGAGRFKRRWVLVALTAFVPAALIALRGLGILGTPEPAEAAEPAVIAALPLANASPDRQVDAFVVGFHDVLLAELSRQPGLQIIGRWSLEQLGDDERDAATLRRRLGADLALTGSVARDEAAIVFTFQLHDTRSGIQRWARSYTEALDVRELLRLQRRVAAAVAREAAPIIAGRGVARGAPEPSSIFPATESLSAYERYLDGLYIVRRIESGRHTGELVAAGRRALEAAIAADPAWAPPYAALGRMLHFVASSETFPEAWRESWERIDQALALDPDYPEALVSLGFLQYFWGADYAASERTYRRVPGDGYLLNWGLGLLYVTLGRIEESIAHYERAVRGDPLNPAIRRQYGWALTCGQKWERALDVWAPLEYSGPEQSSYQLDFAYAEIRSGQPARGRARWARHRDGAPVDGLFHLALGETDHARAVFDRLAVEDPPPFFPAVLLALELGERDRALAWLEQLAATASEPGALRFMLCYPAVRALEGEPRFDRLLAQLGLR